MLKIINNKKNDILIFQRNLAILIATILLVTALFLSFAILKKETTTILVPFGFNDKISISSKRPRNDYLEAISRDIINTMFNLTPNNVDYVEKTILFYADGSAYGTIKSQLEKLKESVVSKKFTTIFYINSIYPNSSSMTATIEGTLHTYFGQKEISKNKKKYEIKYNYKAGRLSLIGFSEIID